jgi:5-methyltetrahydrofolate--homocysteine methyltransferase
MKKAVAYLTPYLEKEKSRGASGAGRVLMATVKGDVHDIGKNIVGVVLGCNNYEVIDLGVMTPVEKILQTAREKNVDVIGLSGLITPSLDEMAHVAKEMQRNHFSIPLLIGGATTSRVHTAVKIAPQYDGDVVHVLDASKSVPVVSSLLNKELKNKFSAKIKQEYAVLRNQHAERRQDKKLVRIDFARENKFKIDWKNFTPAVPSFYGNRIFKNFSLEEIRERIDWTPFFQTWELNGRYPAIFSDKVKGTEARKLFDDARLLLDRIIRENLIQANAVIGFYRAVSNGTDDVHLLDERGNEITTFHFLRQQTQKSPGQPYYSLADFIAPEKDVMGFFAVTAGIRLEKIVSHFEGEHDDYQAILAKSLADRLAEAFAEKMHELVRKKFWGYAPEENLSNEEMINEGYMGIRPAPGYPACPDHTEKKLLFHLLDAEKAGITLTENFAMIPASSVSGFYFSHPQSKYFGLGKIGRDQVEDYAIRKNASVNEMERWLSPNLAYNP